MAPAVKEDGQREADHGNEESCLVPEERLEEHQLNGKPERLKVALFNIH